MALPHARQFGDRSVPHTSLEGLIADIDAVIADEEALAERLRRSSLEPSDFAASVDTLLSESGIDDPRLAAATEFPAVEQ